MSETLTKISGAVIKGEEADVSGLTRAALAEGLTPKAILEDGLMKGMDHVGEQFRSGKMFVPEVLRSARAMQASMDTLKPLLAQTGASMAGKVIIGTVQGDIHDIGKNLVRMMLEGAGFEVIDLGKSVEPHTFVEAVKREKPDILGMSALLTTTMRSMAATIKALQEAGLRDGLKIFVGGAPVTEDFARQIGADGYGSSAPAAVDLARHAVGRA